MKCFHGICGLLAVVGFRVSSGSGAAVGDVVLAERGPHHAVWQRVSERTALNGRRYYVTNSYQEIGTGKNYLKNGQWVPSASDITILPSGFGVATQLQHKVVFAPNINTAGAIDCLTPDDKRLRGHVLGLAYTDKHTGLGVMIAEIKDSVGVLVGNNQVLYPDAFDSEGGFRADIRYTVTIGGLEQDIILVESPPDPTIYGILPENCRIEVYSEFVETSEPTKETVVLSQENDLQARGAMVEPDLIEEKLIFGVMRMPGGTAFRFGENESDTSVPMGKTWEQRDGRQLLIERVDFNSVRDELARLPQVAQVQDPKKAVPLRGLAPASAWASFLPKRPPQAHAAVGKLRGKEMAQAHLPRQGFVLDYVLMTTQTNFTFRGDETYYVSNNVNLSGTTVIDGGTVIKYADGTFRILIQGTLDCRTTPWRRAIFTSKDDDTVGQVISGSTGSPNSNWINSTNGYGRMLDITGNTNAMDVHDIQIRYADYGFNLNSASSLTLRDAQVGYSYAAVATTVSSTARLRNVLIHNGGYALGGAGNFHCENTTFHRLNNFRSSTYTNAWLTNCLIIAVTNNVQFSGSSNQTSSTDSGVFQSAGWGARYLATNSAYRNVGTTNINANLLAALRQMTTFPPWIISNNITANTTLTAQVQRDTDAVDLGYHYPPIDWIMGGLSVTGATLTVTGGATVAIDAAITNWGIRLQSGGHLVSEGDPLNLNRFVRTHSVQEIPSGLGTNTAPLFADVHPAPIPGTSIRFRFTDVAQIQKQLAFNQPNNEGTFTSLVLDDSQFRGGANYLSPNNTNVFIGFTNLLVEDCSWSFYPYQATTLRIANCTFKGSWLGLQNVVLGSDWRVHNNVFDYTTFAQSGTATITNDYNGYLTNAARLTPNGAHDIVLATNTVNFQTGPLGSYYLPTNSAFVNAGSVTNAGIVGLWHYTTRTDQGPETNSWLDLGLHYVALNTLGQPEDSNTPTNGIPNYIEDPNGNGIVDAGETPFTTAIVSITNPTNNAVFGSAETISFTANASAAFSSISWVEFYNGTNLLGQDTTAPFSFAWNNPPAGIHTLTARARADAGIFGTSAPVTITVYGALFVVGSTNLSTSDDAIRSRLDGLNLYPLVVDDSQSSSNDANGKKLIVISKSVTSGNVDDRFSLHSAPLLCWEDPLLDDLKMTGPTDNTHYGSTTGHAHLTIMDGAHPMATNLSGTAIITTTGSEFSWGVPGSNAVKVARLTNDVSRFGIFGYESNTMMFGLEAPSRRAGFFLGNVNTTNLATNGWRLFDAAVHWLTETNIAPSVSWVAPTNGAMFVASTNISLSATANDLDSGMKKVNFYRTGVRIGQADTITQQTNYSLVWSNAIAGNHVLSAKAFDQGGLSSTSAQFIAVTVLSNALFVTGSPTLNASETNVKARIESLGFIVTSKAATNVSTADALGKTVVVISSTASATDLTNKFTYVATPVVVWQKDLFDDLGLTRTNATDVGIAAGQTQLSIISSHALAANLGGTVTVTASSSDFTWGVPGSNAIPVATVVSDAAKIPIFGYEKGSIMAGVGTNTLAAPARRVGFFLTSNTAVSLGSDGWKLFDAAILWATAKPCSSSVDVMLAIDVSQSLSAKDFLRAKSAASNFVNFLSVGFDRVGLVSFASNSILESALTTNLSAVQVAIIGLTNRGGTLLEPPITMCQSNLAFSPAGAVRLLVLLSDGEINQTPQDEHRTNALNAAQAAKNAGTRVVTLAYDNNAPGLALLQGVASLAVDYYYSPDISEMTDVYAAVADTICRFDEPPSITITNPIAGATFPPPASIPIQASATDEHGQVVQVEFFEGTTSLAVDLDAPWWFTWTNVSTGHYTLKAVARDNAGLSSTSAPVNIVVTNVAPSVTVNAPTNGTFFAIPPTNVILTATATDLDGYITNLTFFVGGKPINIPVTTNDNTYSLNWWPVLGGTNIITAHATDHLGATTTSPAISFIVNHPPLVSITNPISPANAMTPNNTITIEASSSDIEASGSVTQVEFFRDETSLGVDNSPPYSAVWANAPTGTYVLAVRATDNNGATRTSSGVTVTVHPTNAPPVVDAGPVHVIRLPAVARLVGRAIDDGLPPGNNLQIWWSKVSGPGTVTFANSNLAATTASFSQSGVYTLRLSASDSQFTVTSNVVISVQVTNEPPNVLTGPDQTVVLAAQVPFLSSTNVSVQQARPDSRGKEFWLAFVKNYSDGQIDSHVLSLSLFATCEKDSWINVTIPGINYATNLSLIANTITNIGIPIEAEMHESNETNNLGIHITSQEEISLYGLTHRRESTDAFLGFPVDVLGTNHIVLGYTNWPQFAVVATRKNTSVTLTPTVIDAFGTTGQTFTVTLNAGQAFMMQIGGPVDFSGTLVSSDKPIALFAGNNSVAVPFQSQTGNTLVEQLPPINTWGTRFVTMPLAHRSYGDRFRLLAAESSTTVYSNGVMLATNLSKGELREFILEAPSHISADKPILLAQFSHSRFFDNVDTSDPFMQLVPPTDQFLSEYVVSTPSSNFTYQYINVVCPTGIVGQVKLDGTNLLAGNFVTIGGSGFAGSQVEITNGSHRLHGPSPFGVFVYGFEFADGYGYVGGMSLSEVVKASSLVLSPNPATNEFSTERCVLASVIDQASQPLPGLRIEFQVTGANANSGYAITEQNGVARFCYYGGSIGTDVIQASVGGITAKATNYWVQPFASLAGSASDDGLPSGLLTTLWENVNGPALVTFSPTNTLTNVQARIPQPGVYVLRLRASDGSLASTNSMTLTAIRNQAPLVDAGASHAFKGETTILRGSATDDGLPTAPLSVNWAAMNATSSVAIANASQPHTSVTFKSPGTYQLRLTANDGDVAISSDVIITNLPETVALSCDQTITNDLSALDREAVGRPGIRGDFYRLNAGTNGVLVIEMTSTNVDSFLSLYTKDLQLIATDDDSLETNNAKLVCQLPYVGEYILEASSSFTNQTGAYSLQVGCGTLPYVRITTPANGAVYTNVPVTPMVTANAYDMDGIAGVVFYLNGSEFDSDASAPYESSIPLDQPGIHALFATALDSQGNWATSAPVVMRVVVPPLTLTPACPGIPGMQHTVTATLRDNSGVALPGTNIQFTVIGANSASGSQITDASGQASFTYAGLNPGYDQITASATVSGGTTTASGGKSWAYPLACNQVSTGALASTDQVLYPYRTYADYYWFYALSNDYAVLSLWSTNFDTFLSIYDANCTLLASNDDFYVGEFTDSKLGLVVTNSGIYLLEVTSFHPLETGGYSLLMECIAPTAQPEIAVFLASQELPNHGLIEFGMTTNGTPINKVLTITNRGDRQLVVDNVAIAGDFSTTNATSFVVAPAAATNFTVRFNAATNGLHSSYVAFYNDDGDGGDGLERPFVLNLTAICNTGAPPTVTLTAPANNTVLPLPTNVVLTAEASSSVSSITNVEFIGRKDDRFYSLGNDTASPYSITSYPPAGKYVLMAVARDDQGRIGISQGVNLEVKAASTNLPPVAAQDYPAVLANSIDNVLYPLDNDTDAERDPLTITSVFDLHGGHAEVINNGKNLLYVPPFGIRGGDYFRYTITDGQGGFASSVVNVRIDATDAPTVQITSPAPNATLTAGAATSIQAAVTPGDFKGKVEFFFHDHKIGEDTTDPYSVSWIPIEDPCNCGLTAVATDVFGQIATSLPVMVNIVPPDGDAAPIARISNLTNEIVSISGHKYSRAATVREGLFEVLGDAYITNSSPVGYKLRIFNSERELVRDVTPPPLNADGFRVGAVTNCSLGVLDLSLVDNGLYDLELTVRAGYRQSSTNVRFALESDLKIGHFSFSEEDLVLPVNGFPLTITRTYNSLNLKKGEFGRSWTHTFSDLQLELDEDRTRVESLFEDEGDETVEPSGQFFSLRVGGERNVTLTLPDGRRTTFYYYLEATSCDSSEFKFCAWPRWVAGPGVFANLRTINDVKLAVLPWSGGMEWWTDDGSSDPDNYEFPGYILTMPDGTEYRIERESLGEKTFVSGGNTGNYAHVYGAGRLVEIKSRSNDKIRIGTNRIDHWNPSDQLTRSIWLQRDEENRIIAINDPISGSNGVPVVKYDYVGDNLVHVHRLVDRATSNYLTTAYTYTNRNYPHYITGITDPRGIQVARNLYDEGGRLIGIVDADGRTNSFVHNISNRWEIALNPKGQGVTNVFDIRGNITNRIDALGRTNHFRYDTNGYMLAHIDPLGNTTTYSNDARGNVLETTLPYPSGADPVKYTTRYTYDTNDNQTSIVLPTGGVITNKFDSLGNLLETRDGAGNIISTNAYDANGLMIAEGDQFGALRFGHDAMGNATVMTNSLNQVIASAYDANGDITNLVENGITSTFTYDGQGRDRFANYGNGITLSNGYNSQLDWNSVDGPTIGHMERRFDNQGRLSGWTTVNGAQPGFAYNENGQMEYETNSIRVVTRQVYDAAGRLISVTNLTTGAGASYAHDATGRRIAETNALGHVTRFDYNPDGSLKSMTNAFGTNVWMYSYDTGAGCCGGNGGTTTTVIDPLGREVTDIRSPLGLPLQLITKLGTNAVTNTTAYLSGIVSPDQEGEEYPASITDEGGRTRNFGYTALGQLERASDLSGTTYWTNRYSSVDGSLLEVISPTGETNSFVYDDLDNVKSNRFSDGNLLINYYNTENRLASNALPSGASLHLKYDSAGRLTNRISSIGESAGFAYNGNDAVTLMTDNTGTTTNLYDAAGRLVGINFPTGASIRYELDKLDRIVAITNRAFSSGTAYITRYAYDAVGNITNVTDPFGGQTSLQYDRVGRRTKRTLPNGVTTDWQYNWRDQVTNIVHKNSGSTVLASVAYERAPFGEPTKITREDGSYVVLKYDSALRLTNEQHYAPGDGLIESIGYGYDTSGSRIRLSNNSGTFTNAVEKGYRVATIKRQSDGATTETYAYDTGGRVTSISRSSATLTFGYNTADQLAAITNGANWTQYTHDASGRRTQAIDQSSAKRRFLVADSPGTDLESPHLIADANNTLKQGYVYLGDQPIVRFDSAGSFSRVYYLEDGLGSIIGLAPQGSPDPSNTSRLFYDGFGSTRNTNGPSPTIPSGTGGDFRFHAGWWESASDLYHMRAREYDPHTAKFLSRDPVRSDFTMPEGLNPYPYANNSPQLYSDRSGLFTLIEIDIVGAINAGMNVGRAAAAAHGRRVLLKQLGKVAKHQLESYLRSLLPLETMLNLGLDTKKLGAQFQKLTEDFICEMVPIPKNWLYLEPRILTKPLGTYKAGDVRGNGITCNERATAKRAGGNTARPDFLISRNPPLRADGTTERGYLVGEIKLSGSSFRRAYLGKEPKQAGQWGAIMGYAGENTYSHTAVFISFYKVDQATKRMLNGKAAISGKGVLLTFISVVPAKSKPGRP